MRQMDGKMAATSKKIRLGVLFGGRSGEHDVSLVSAASVMEALLDHEEFEIIAIGLTRAGGLADEDELRAMLPGGLRDRVRLCTSIEAAGSGMRVLPNPPAIGRENGVMPEIIFPLLHGTYGEDGTVQGLFEIADIPYVGCGVLASAVAMDKDVVKRLWAGEGLPVTPWITARAGDIAANPAEIRRMAEKAFGYPMFSKPANLGSSVGVHKIHDETEFYDALRDSARYDRKVLIEKGIDAREIECAILGNDDPKASVTGEVLPAGEFYDYEAKYVRKESRLEIPANIDGEKAEEIRTLAVRAFRAIDGAGLARVDFFLEKETGEILINEINTMPGFTPISMYSKLWASSGVPFPDLVRRLIGLGKQRFEEKSARKTDRR
ncbi:MAG: D-alanine--D-alanine ligase [Acidobacteriota bacterium]|jgi:D-alanine-D-alanine ligase|nr:D-alanine--D-alanine ligase [Acidobacteriota bacterium]